MVKRPMLLTICDGHVHVYRMGLQNQHYCIYAVSSDVCSSGLKGLYDDMDREAHCLVADSGCLSLRDSSVLTPIDRLYSMQDSYFAS